MIILKSDKHKHKFNRRRALECRLVEKSKNNPGYLKYMVTIGEKNGDTSTQPAYGKDMQDALSRLLHKERLVRVEKKLDNGQGAGWIFIAWLIMMGTPVYFMESYDSPVYILYAFVGLGVMIGLAMWYWNYVNKK
tara:strand:- start:719 stop:1123 length:405 start_codon:yes stop_codon:yes gene_type:complete